MMVEIEFLDLFLCREIQFAMLMYFSSRLYILVPSILNLAYTFWNYLLLLS